MAVKLFLLSLQIDPAGYYWPGHCISHFNALLSTFIPSYMVVHTITKSV